MTATREPPSCRSCRHVVRGWALWPLIRADWRWAECAALTYDTFDPVSGRRKTHRHVCWLSRKEGGRCGPTGRYYQPKTEGERG